MVAAPGSGPPLHAFFGAILFGAVLGASWQLFARSHPQPAHRPQELPEEGYVTSKTCRACHPGPYASWFDSYHSSMTTQASPATIRGAIDGSPLHDSYQVFRLQSAGQRVWMTATVPGGPEAQKRRASALPPMHLGAQRERQGPGAPDPEQRFPISMVTGSHHMQVLWYETGKGRELGQFPFAYLIEDQEWVPRRMVFLQPPLDFQPSEQGRWNQSCIHCHTTRGRPEPDSKGVYDTRMTEMGVGCESCHGPAEAHVQRYRDPLARYRSYLQPDSPTDITNPAELDPLRASQICSQCHGLWLFDQEGNAAFNKHGMSFRPGQDAEDSMWLMAPSRKRTDKRVEHVMRANPDYIDGQFWSDGQARVSGREFHGMIDSACAIEGDMSCMSCHTMHQAHDDPRPRPAWADDQLGVGMDGDQACVGCHEDLGQDLAAHTHHEASSSGSRCYNCHMPYTSYGLLKAIRSHKITVPSASETVATGRPNACNMCHLDQSLSWTADALRDRWGMREPELEQRAEHTAPLSVVQALKGDAAQRALWAWAYGWQAAREASAVGWVPPFLGILLDDHYDAVRYIARKSIRRYPGFEGLQYDFTIGPGKRPPLAPEIAKSAAGRLGQLPSQVPLNRSGQLDETAKELLAGRDQRPLNLLE
ncbi:MAG: multiheme c-type cytochrome [Myxococcales bacterium]|nr:multiheme c-type cytochrome [Myxococcales bacterium]MDD9965714.1 multiheme c-type cytochrome [Myxococcales bacterium]